ncbi:MAG: MBL fold metallo-hydrolase [Clostridia bacterium]|nr:MBL fold metallo-hydrolase [Clostridia bacterium]
MIKVTKSFLVLLAVLTIILLAISCSTNNSDELIGDDTSINVTEQTSLTIFENGQYNCVIVIPHRAPADVENTALSLALNMSKATSGISPSIVSDKEYEGKDTSGDNMILIGETTIKGTEETFVNSKYGTVYAQLIGNKFQVLINDSKSASYFIEKAKEIVGSTAVSSITIDESWNISETLDEAMSVIEIYDGGYVDKNIPCGDGSSMKIIKSTSAEDYKAYIEKTKAAGGKIYSENQIGNNLFTTVKFDGYNATFVHLGNIKQSRLIMVPADDFPLPELEEENVYTKVCSTSVTQLGVEGAGKQNGMSYIFKLADGRFAIIDGGHDTKKMPEILLNTLHDLAEDPSEITVAAWFITHPHDDHWGALLRISELEDNGGINIERIVYNIPDDSFFDIAEARIMANELMAKHKENGTKIYKAQPGQVLHLADVDFTIYSTPDLYLPFSGTKINNTSLIIRATVAGQSLLFPGDSAVEETASIIDIYGESLKSDFLQVVHHGYGGADTKFYELVDPQILFWPVGLFDYYDRGIEDGGPVSKRPINEYFFREEGTSLKEMYVAGESVVTIPLPYDNVTKAD